MPNMVSDGFIDQAQFIHAVALVPGNSDYALQNAVAIGIGNAAVQGLFTATVTVSAYSNTLTQLLVERLVNLGYGATLTSTTIVVTW